jgi:serralysin
MATIDGSAGNDVLVGIVDPLILQQPILPINPSPLPGGVLPVPLFPPLLLDRGDLIQGFAGDDDLQGLATNDTLLGGLGNDRLDGGAGADQMDGGDGDDLYVVDNIGDVVREVYNDALGGTADLVLSSVSYSLSPGGNGEQGYGIENLTLTGSDNTSATGNQGNNILIGNSGDNTFFGTAGNDALTGSTGNDRADYSALGQTVSLGAFGVVTKGGGLGTDSLNGIETIVASTLAGDTIDGSAAGAPATGLTVNLGLGSVSVNGLPFPLNFQVQNFENATGSAFADTLTGGPGVNALAGGGGNDRLTGRGGADQLTGGFGNDRFVLGERGVANADRITDFSNPVAALLPWNDSFTLERTLDNGLVGASLLGIKGLAFSGGNLPGNSLAAGSFFKGAGLTGAGFANAAGIYVNTSTGDLFYNDALGLGSHLIARVSPGAASSLSAADFQLG